MNARNFLILIVVASLFIGCTPVQRMYALDSGIVALELSDLRDKYDGIESAIRKDQDQKHRYSAEEWAELEKVDASIDLLILKFDAIVRLDKAHLSLSDISFMYSLSVDAYTRGRAIVQKHWDKYPPATQINLRSFDDQAIILNTKINKLLSDPSNVDINAIMTTIATTLSMAIKILAIAGV